MIIAYTTRKGQQKHKLINPVNTMSWKRHLLSKGCYNIKLVY